MRKTQTQSELTEEINQENQSENQLTGLSVETQFANCCAVRVV